MLICAVSTSLNFLKFNLYFLRVSSSTRIVTTNLAIAIFIIIQIQTDSLLLHYLCFCCVKILLGRWGGCLFILGCVFIRVCFC